MPLFQKTKAALNTVEQTNFDTEKSLQHLIEQNLETVFNCRFVASEFATGALHGGRIDTLALSEDNNPVIIEYKKVESSELINQSLFYLAWIQDHRGDFEIAAQKALGADVEVDWGDIRVICIAPNFRKYDLHAVQVMGANLELWSYRLFKNDSLYLEEVFQKSIGASSSTSGESGLTAGQKAALTRKTGIYTFEEHLEGRPEPIRQMAVALQEFMLGLDPSMEESPKKFYVAYKISQNIVCMEVQQKRILLYLKLDPTSLENLPKSARDVREIGHYGTGDLELSVKIESDLDAAMKLCELAYQRVGG
jgi:predicted transport protein